MSGINILRRLLLKEAVKGSGQASGIMSIGDSVRKLAEKRLQSYLLSAQKQGVDLDKLGEQEIRYMLEMNKPKAPRVISQGDPEFKGITEALLGKQGQVIEGKFGKPFGETITDDIIRDINNMETIPSMKEMNKVIKRDGRYKNLTDKDVDKIFKATEDRTSGRLDDIDPEDMYADGGVAGLLGERQGFANGRRSYSASQYSGGSKKSKSKSKSYSAPRGGGADMGTVSTPTRKANPNLVARAEAEQKQADQTNRRIAANEATISYALKPPKKSLRQKIGSGINRVLNFPPVRTYAFYGTGGASEKLRQAMLAKQLYDSRKYLMDEIIEDEIRNIPITGGISSSFFPEGDLQNIIATSPTQKDYNIRATKDLVENLPGGVVRDVLAPAAAGAMSLPYDAIQAAKRTTGADVARAMDTATMSGPRDIIAEAEGLAYARENPLSSLKERTIGAAGPLAERFGLEQGGRVPFAMGRRAFLKLLGVGGAGIAGLKTGVGLGGKKVATEVAKDVVTTSGPPPYFFNLVNKIKTLGDDALASQDKAKAYKYKDYTMEEDFAGNIEIKKTNYGMFGDEIAPTEEVYMSYTVDEVPLRGRGKKKSTKVEEYEEYTARPDEDGKMKDVESGVPDDVIEDGTMFEDNMTDFGKADGGIARMLGE